MGIIQGALEHHLSIKLTSEKGLKHIYSTSFVIPVSDHLEPR